MRRRTLNNLKIACIYGSALFLCHTLRTVPKIYANDAQQSVIHNVVNSDVENSAAEYTESKLSKELDDEDMYCLAKIAMAEAEGEDAKGKALVIRTVLNRVEADGFPDNVEDAILQAGQFESTVDEGRYWNLDPSQECYDAVYMVKNGWDESEGSLYFETVETVSWMDENTEYLFTHGNHKFYR